MDLGDICFGVSIMVSDLFIIEVFGECVDFFWMDFEYMLMSFESF